MKPILEFTNITFALAVTVASHVKYSFSERDKYRIWLTDNDLIFVQHIDSQKCVFTGLNNVVYATPKGGSPFQFPMQGSESSENSGNGKPSQTKSGTAASLSN